MLLRLEILPSRYRTLVGTSESPGSSVLGDAITVYVDERPGGEIVLPAVNADFSHIDVAARHADRCRNSVYDLIIPLVEDGKSPITSGDTRQSKPPILIALREGDVSAIRATQTGVALGVAKGIAAAAAVQSFIRRPAHTRAR